MDIELLKKAQANIDKFPPAVQQKIGELIAEARKLSTRESVNRDFMSFVNYVWPTFIHGKHHKIMASAFERVASGECKRLIINMPPRHRLNINTPIPTVTGWKTVETVQVGDYVFAPDGNPVLVTGKSDVYTEALYEVVTSDNQVIECDGEHLWTVRFGAGRIYKTYSTKDILYKLETESWRKAGNLPLLPTQKAAKYPHADLPIDPYVFGVWLGDGSSWSSSIGCSYKDLDAMRSQIEACGYKTTHNPKFQQFNILQLHTKLHALGVIRNKHIPECYLCASVEQRTHLLQGLIDTDGDVTKKGKVTFNQTDIVLTTQVLCLIHSLGIKAQITRRQTHYKGVPSKPSYRIMFTFSDAARLPRKAALCKAPEGNWGRSIDVRRTDKTGFVQCLEVANEDGLFMAGRGWVVTHNTKSEFASYLLPAWFLGQHPHKQIIQTAHTTELAVNFGRKVRNLVDSEPYKDLFPSVGLRADSKAAGRWNTTHNGIYFSIGIGGAVTGRGADLFIIDDPHSEQEATLAEVNPEIYDKTFEWYTSGPRQRLQPGGAIVIVMCMTGDTPVLMHNGLEKPLRDIRPGDKVATYNNNRVTTAKVKYWQSSGLDSVYTLQTQSGKLIRANDRHPFLVDVNGNLQWIRLKNLKPGDVLVTVALRNAPKKAALNPPEHWDYASHTTVKSAVNPLIHNVRQWLDGLVNSNIATALHKPIMTLCGLSRRVYALSVVNRLGKTLKRVGTASCALIIAMTQEKLGLYYATAVIWLLGMVRRLRYSLMPLSIYEITRDVITEIAYNSTEEVFDVQIERTENFIANGIVSHNTRWSKKDLTGQILKASAQRADEHWEVIEFPAILPSGRALWPQFWSIKELEVLRDTLPSGKWMAQYQQQPTSDVSAIIKREWWKMWEHDDAPECDYILQSWDTAFTKNERSDYSACTTWGIFYQPDDTGIQQANIILLNAFKERMEFPELKARTLREYNEWTPDSLIIEAKASGAPLIQELRAMGIPVQEFTPTKGNDKIARLNACSDVFASGRVWAPNKRWAEEVIDDVASFPSGEHDDLVDSTSQAILRYRQGGFIRTLLDEDDDNDKRYKRKRVFY